jgi:hypothetical protein
VSLDEKKDLTLALIGGCGWDSRNVEPFDLALWLLGLRVERRGNAQRQGGDKDAGTHGDVLP